MRAGGCGRRLYWGAGLWHERFGSMFPVSGVLPSVRVDDALEMYADCSCSCSMHAEMMPAAKDDPSTPEQRKIRALIEKKTVINLIEAFAVSVKHYLRGEEGVYYVDLYHLVKFLPSYALPPGMPSLVDLSSVDGRSSGLSPRLRARGDSSAPEPDLEATIGEPPASPMSPSFSQGAQGQLPLPATARKVKVDFPSGHRLNGRSRTFDEKKGDKGSTYSGMSSNERAEDFLLPARNPPKYHLLDLFPFSLLVGFLAKRGKEVKVRPLIAFALCGSHVRYRVRKLLAYARSFGARPSPTTCHLKSPCIWFVKMMEYPYPQSADWLAELVYCGAAGPQLCPSPHG